MGNLFTCQAKISFSERIALRVLVVFHTSDTEMTLFPKEGKGREAAEMAFCEWWMGT